MSSESATQTEPLITDEWLHRFESSVYRCARTQLVKDQDAHRLVALAMLVTLGAHQMLSELGGTSPVRNEIARFYAEHAQGTNVDEAEPPSLSEMTVIMDMVATAFSLIEHRRTEIGAVDTDVPTEILSGALLQLMNRACRSGGAKASASVLLPLIRRFADCVKR